MTRNVKIIKPISSEYESIQRFLEDVYGHSYNYFPSTYPSVWKKDNTDFKNTFVIKEKGKIVSLVRIFPLKTVQAGVDVNLAGIGAVSTLYSHRGKGYMNILLQRTFEEMKKQKFPLSVLGGDRHRYNNFGYENGGKVVELTVSTRGLKKLGIQSVPSYRYDNTDKKVLKKIIEASMSLRYRKKRNISEFEDLYKRHGVSVYYTAKGDNFAFVVISATEVKEGVSKNILECGGSSVLIPCILQYLVERFGFTAFTFHLPDFTEIPENIMSIASSWNIMSPLMIKIIDLKQTMEILSKRDDFLFPDNEEITLTVKDKESVVIKKEKGTISVFSGKGKNEISLTEIEMVRLIFGSSLWVPYNLNYRLTQILRQFLPLPIYLPPLDRI